VCGQNLKKFDKKTWFETRSGCFSSENIYSGKGSGKARGRRINNIKKIGEQSLEIKGDFEVFDDGFEVGVGFIGRGPSTNSEFVEFQRLSGIGGSETDSHVSIGRDVVEGEIVIVVEESELPFLGSEGGIEFILGGEVVVIVDGPGRANSISGIHVEGEHSNILKISLVERKLEQEIAVEGTSSGNQTAI